MAYPIYDEDGENDGLDEDFEHVLKSEGETTRLERAVSDESMDHPKTKSNSLFDWLSYLKI